MKLKATLSSFLLLSSFLGLSQTNFWTLDQCLEEAYSKNILINQSKLTTDQKRISLKQSKGAFLPSAYAGASHNYQFGRSVDPSTNKFEQQSYRTNDFSITSSLTLFKGLQNIRSVEQNQMALKASHYDLENSKNEIGLSVVSAYMQVLLSYELVENAKAQIESSTIQLENLERQVDAGSIPELNKLQIIVQLSLERVTLAEAENDLLMAKLTLMQLMELPVEESFEIEKPSLRYPTSSNLPEFSTEQIFNNALASHPQIKSMEYNKKSALSAIRVAQGAKLPQITLSSSIFTFYSSLNKQYRQGMPTPIEYPFYSQLNDQIGKQVSVNLSVPILRNRIFSSSIERAKINYNIAELDEKNARNQIRKNIEQANADIKAAAKRIEATQNALSSYEKAYLNAEKRLKAGLLNPSEFIIQKNSFVLAQSKHIQSVYNYHFKLKVLLFYQSNDRSILQ